MFYVDLSCTYTYLAVLIRDTYYIEALCHVMEFETDAIAVKAFIKRERQTNPKNVRQKRGPKQVRGQVISKQHNLDQDKIEKCEAINRIKTMKRKTMIKGFGGKRRNTQFFTLNKETQGV